MTAPPTNPPQAQITNGLVRASVYLPDAQAGFYRGTRFDWSGVVSGLQTNGHNYYGPWFDGTDPSVHDFVYRDEHIVAGPCSAITGPVDEFAPLGYDEAKQGGTFVKIGVGALRKTDTGKYDNYHLYEVADGGHWKVETHSDSLQFTQHLDDKASGYGYVYRKSIRLTKGKSEMILSRTLKNTGRLPIHTNVYNHNFLVLDGKGPGPGVTISLPFSIQTSHAPDSGLAEIRGHQLAYIKQLTGKDVVATPFEGFGSEAAENQVTIESKSAGAGMKFQTDRPLLKESLWSIRSVLAVEPFIDVAIEPGAEFSWTTVYEYYALAGK